MKKGITLISLVITIILILILAGVGISGSLALIEEAKYTAFINEMKQLDEAIQILILEKQLQVAGTDEKIELFKKKLENQKEIDTLPEGVRKEVEYIRALLAKEEGIEETLPSDYEGNIEYSEEEGKGIYYIDKEYAGGKEEAYIYDEQSASVYKIEPTIIWGVEMHGYEYGNLLVTQPGLLEKAQNKEEIPSEPDTIELSKEYKLTNGVYMCEPNTTGFKQDTTYYVTWNTSGQEEKGNNLLGEKPTNWYNYPNKEWANIVTENNNKKAYFVWIPRYVYKIGENETVDVRFVDKNNYWVNPENPEEIIQYTDETPIYDEETGLQTNYVLPEGFDFGEEGNKIPLEGYWVGKYEISEDSNKDYQIIAGQKSAVSTTADDFFYKIRKMEAEGQVLGLTETLKADDSGEAETNSNGLDCHMMKNTEYGPVAMLAASQYGNAPQGYGTTSDGDKTTSTTQNETGIYQMINYYSTSGGNEKAEHLAAVNSNIGSYSDYCGKLRNSVNKKYVDIYDNETNINTDYNSAKVGDVTKETVNWYGATVASFVRSNSPVFDRGAYGLFSFFYSGGNSNSVYSSRAVIVCGTGL